MCGEKSNSLKNQFMCKAAKIKGFINDVYSNVGIEIPDSMDLLSANKLQEWSEPLIVDS